MCIILSAPVNASQTGSIQAILNAATIQNKGAELTLNLHPIQSPNAGWDVGVQYGRNRGKVLSLNGAQFITYNLEGFQGAIGASAIGFAPGVIQGNDFARCGLGITDLSVPGLGVVSDLDALCCASTSSLSPDCSMSVRVDRSGTEPVASWTFSEPARTRGFAPKPTASTA